MVETTLHIRLLPGGEECVIASNLGGEKGQQAELVAFGQYAARTISLAGPAGAGAVIAALLGSRPEGSSASGSGEGTVTARFVDGAAGPRTHFRVRTRGELGEAPSVSLLLETLANRHRDERFRTCLAETAELLGRLGATGQVTPENEFDLALATADVAWRREDARQGVSPALECPSCGNTDSFEPYLWPSDGASLHKCERCSAGVWRRDGHPARLIRADVWSAMESMRAELGGAPRKGAAAEDGTRSLYTELKRAFAENGWPYSEVDGAPVLLSELSGPEGRWDFYAQAVEDRGLVLLYSIAPQRIPGRRRIEVAEFLTRANYGLADGNFELDFEDGELRFKTVLHVHGDELDGLLLRRLVRANGIALETYLPSIGSLIADGG